MTKLGRKLLAILSTGAILANLLVAPVAAETTIEISGNGSGSNNSADVSVTQSTTVSQANFADVRNFVDASAETGDNKAKDNTGGNVSIETGDATTMVKVENDLNSNMAKVDCCPTGDTEVLISGNGSDSVNNVDLTQDSATDIEQFNAARVQNDVYARADTGDNKAKDNTGGNVTIETGDAKTTVDVSTQANTNWAMIGGDGSAGGSLSLRIIGNGAGSNSAIDVALAKSILVSQANFADVRNFVDASAETGDNKAKDNTGGNVTIETGDATTNVDVANDLNFNWADLDCGCLLDIMAKIAGNGSDSVNSIKATLDDSQEAQQFNACGLGEDGDLEDKVLCDTDVYAKADTGDNKIKKSTGDPGGDPSIETGDAETDVDVSNSGNVNVVGQGLPEGWPEWPDFDFGFSWLDLLLG